MKKFRVVFILMLLFSCVKEGIETHQYLLTDMENEFIPYQQGQSLSFVHSGGLEFHMRVSADATTMKKSERVHKGDNYVSYEQREVSLNSEVPDFFISLTINPIDYRNDLRVSVNNYNFGMDFLRAPDYDSLTLLGNQFMNIYEMLSYYDSTLISPYKILYTKEDGIIQICMTNDEKYTLKK